MKWRIKVVEKDYGPRYYVQCRCLGLWLTGILPYIREAEAREHIKRRMHPTKARYIYVTDEGPR